MDLRQSPQYARYLEASGWQVKRVGNAYVFLKSLIFGLKMAKVQRYQKLDLNRLQLFLRVNRVVYTVLEPEEEVETSRYSKFRFFTNHSPYLPTKTLTVDLSLSKEKLWRNLSENLKRILRQKKQTKLTQPLPETFYRAWQKNSKLWPLPHKNFMTLLRCFKKQSLLFASAVDGNLVSGILVLTNGRTAYYYQAWTSLEGRRLNAHHHLVWQTILKLKKLGFKKFDFDGIEDSRFPHASWQGFSQFKRKFGCQEIEYPGSFSRWL